MPVTDDSDVDTETLLAMLKSLTGDRYLSQEQLLDALLDADGDVESAARHLVGEGSSTGAKRTSTKKKSSSKRKTTEAVLDDWLISPGRKFGQAKKRRVSPSARREKESGSVIDLTKILESKGKDAPRSPIRASESPKKPTVNLMEILRPPPPSPAIAPKLPPLTLGTRSLIEEHTPTTLHSSVLPPELACKLFYKMLDEAEAHWRRSKWYVVDKLVESPHLTSFYVRGEQSSEWHKAARHWYNGFAAPTPPTFPAELEEACLYVEKVVNSALAKRKRYPMEWGGDGGWRANVAAANRYKGGKEGVGFHSDGMTYLGPYCTIASLSLGTERIFRLRETISKDEKNAHAAQTYNISLPHNSLIIMHASCQEHFKHSIPIIPSTGIDIFKPSFPRDDKTPIAAHTERINVTFRFFRPDFAPETIPKCKCDVPMVLRANQKGSGRLAVESGAEMRYFWMCYGGAHNEGKGCGQLKVLDMKAEGRGPFYGETEEA